VTERISLTIDNHTVEFVIPPAASRPSAFAFSLHKAGSVLFYRVLAGLAETGGVPALNFPGESFRQGLGEKALPQSVIGPILMRDGYIFTGFRLLLGFIPEEALAGRRKILLIRDPRDMLVSLYFSHRYSHFVPASGPARDEQLAVRAETSAVDIDTFVLSKATDRIARNYRTYMQTVGPDWRVYRYEDVIFRKREWLADMAGYLGLPVGRRRLKEIADKNDIRPAREDEAGHARQLSEAPAGRDDRPSR
jgi:hypothetical protein